MKNILASILATVLVIGGVSISGEASTRSIPVKMRVEAAAKTHWLTTSSRVRHRKGCRWYKKSKGRMCTKDEGRACKKCGG